MSRRDDTRPEIRVGGFWLSTIAPNGWGDLRHATRVRGSWEMSWQMPFERNWRHPALVGGARVDLRLGAGTLWTGTLEEPDWDESQFVAIGACRDAETAIALDAAGNASTKPNEVIDAAIARGVLSWTRVDNIGTTAVGSPDDAGTLVYLDSVLDAWEQENNSRIRVNGQRQVVIAPTSESNPTYYVTPGSGVLGMAVEERVDRIFVRYIDAITGARATASYPATTPAGGNEAAEDIRDRGPMSAARAQSIAQGMWSDLRGMAGWTNGLRLLHGQVTNKGGVPVDLALIKAGDAIRLLGVPDPRGLGHHTDVVIGDTDYNWTDDEIQVNPVGMAARDEESTLEQVGNLAVDAVQKAKAVPVADTNWIALTSSLGGVAASYRVKDGEVTVRLTGTATSMASGANVAVVTSANGLPVGTRPASNTWTGGFVAGGLGGMGVNTDGSVFVRHEAGAARSGTVAIQIPLLIG